MLLHIRGNKKSGRKVSIPLPGRVIAATIADVLVARLQQLVKTKFFARDEPPVSPWQVFLWWEARRVPYNLIVGAAGVITCTLCVVTDILSESFLKEPFGLPNPPLVAVVAVIAYGVMANVCYTGGWIAEIIVRKIWPLEGQSFGKISFAMGFVFSLLMTLLPGFFIAGLGAIGLLAHALAR